MVLLFLAQRDLLREKSLAIAGLTAQCAREWNRQSGNMLIYLHCFKDAL